MSSEKPAGRPRRKVYTEEFRRSVVDHLLTSGKSAAEVGRDFGVSDGKVRMWKKRYGPQAKPPADPLPPPPQSPEELARENQQLRRELVRVTLQRDILKKTMVIFSEQWRSDIE
jgi:transposase